MKLNLSKEEIIKNIKEKKVLIALVAKNVNKFIKNVINNSLIYASYFKEYKIIIIDGFSYDGTYETCKEFEKNNENCKVYRQYSNNLSRPLALSEARNMYIEFFEKDFEKDTYLLCLDCDEVNSNPVDVDGFLSNFNYSLEDWDMMSANQINCYYDIYALRNEECPWNYQHKIRETGDIYTYLTKLQIPKPRDHPLIKVESAFGGAAIYHTEKLKNCRYSSYVNNIEICEHVPFHKMLIENGGKLFINPNFINF
jgi:hypothetical protein